MALNAKELKEYVKCADDPVYFIENYVKIVHVDYGLVPFKMYPFQKKMVQMYHNNRFSITLASRQIGKSTTVIGYFLHQILFNANWVAAILANKQDTAADLLSRLKLAYESLPLWLQQGIEDDGWNSLSVKLENGSRIMAAATRKGSIRGKSLNAVLLDEFAFVPENMAQEFFTSTYPTISSGQTTKIIIVSTPNGYNLFHKLYREAVRGVNGYGHICIPWTDVPGRDKKWENENRAVLGDRFDAEYGCEFQGSLGTLISSKKLSVLTPQTVTVPRHDSIRIFEAPQPGHSYLVSVDTSTGQGLDDQAFSVTDITALPYRQVAAFNDSKTTLLQYPYVLYEISTYYNHAFIFCEVNDVGGTVAHVLANDLEYENILTTIQTPKGQRVSAATTQRTRPGLKMTPGAKRIGCASLKSLVEQDKLIVQDYDTIRELSTFVEDGKRFAADEGHKDDLVMRLVIFAWLAADPYIGHLTDVNLRQAFIKLQQDSMDSLLPFGFLDDGVNEIQDGNIDYSKLTDVETKDDTNILKQKHGDMWLLG